MPERVTTIRLALPCALLFSAIVVQSASAQVGVNATNTTAVTCVKGGGNLDFKDKHCDEKIAAGTGEFGHVTVVNGKTKAVEVSNEGNTVFATTHLGVNIEISCTKVSSTNSWLESKESGKEHKVEGTVKLELTGCTSVKPASCKVKEPIETIAIFRGVEGLKFGAETKAMGLEFSQDGGKNFFEFSYGLEAACPFKGKTFPVTGSTIATGKPNPGMATKQSGVTFRFESANEMDTMKFATSNADVLGTLITKGSGGSNPIALTTVT